MPKNREPRSAPTSARALVDGRPRVVIEGVAPAVDGGRFAVKRIVGDEVVVEADCFADGHDVVACVVRWWREGNDGVDEVPMSALGNDRWRGSFVAPQVGRYRYTIVAWVDHFLSWRHDFERRIDAEDLRIAALVGADLIDAAAARAHGDDRQRLRAWAKQLRAPQDSAKLRDAGA